MRTGKTQGLQPEPGQHLTAPWPSTTTTTRCSPDSSTDSVSNAGAQPGDIAAAVD